jgi:autotransporter-associated beta strand protein
MKILNRGRSHSTPKSSDLKPKTHKIVLCAALFCCLATAHAATKTWDGSASGFWTNAANWSGNVAPTNGDSLVFPVGLSRVLMTNTAGAPSNFLRLDFFGSNYMVFGPTLTLTNGITNAVNNFSTNTLNCPIRVGADQTWTNRSRAALVLNGSINLDTHTLTFGSLGDFQVNGALTNSGNLVKLGNGGFSLNGSNTFNGALTMESGPLRVDGAIASASLTLNGGSLAGSGSVHDFTAHSGTTVLPGDEFVPGRLTCLTDAKFETGASFEVDLNGTVVGTDYDQLVVNGNVDLGGAALVRVIGFVPVAGDRFVILQNNGPLPIANTFANLPEGALLTNGATVLQITYAGGDGNDVELIVLDFAPRVWSGLGTNALWSNASNWVNQLGPLPHDQLVFPPDAARPVSTNDLPVGTAFDTITLSGSNYFIAGNGFTLDTAITNSPVAGTNTLNCSIALTLTNTAMSVGTNSALALSGALTGTGGLAKIGIGQLTLSGTNENTYSGPTTVAPGLLLLNKPAGTNAIAGPLVLSGTAKLLLNDQIADSTSITLNSGGTLDLNSKSDTVGPLTLNGGLITTLSGTLFMNGDAVVNGDAAISGNLGLGAVTRSLDFSNATADLIVGAHISGSGGLTKNGSGQLTLGNSNSFSGPLTINSGTLKINHPFALGSTNGATLIESNANITLLEDIGFEPLILNSTGDPLANFGAVLAVPSSAGISVSWAGNVTLAQNSPIYVGGGSALALSGAISGPGELLKVGSGKLTLSGNNIYNNETHVNAGTLLVNGVQPLSSVIVSNSTLGGTGTVGTIVVITNGTVSPGASPGILNSSNVTFNPLTHFAVELNGTNQVSDYDQLNVTGSVTLDGTLTGSVGFIPDIGSTFTIINNDGTDAIQGGFQGLGEGAIFSLGGFQFQISYQGGIGSNDVVLTHLAAPPSQISSLVTVTNGFEQLLGAGLSNLIYVIQANTNLATTNWLTIGNVQANSNGVFSFTDTSAPSFPMRFYRVLSP